MTQENNSSAIRIGILGAGTWGIALARMLQNNGKSVTVWSPISAELTALRATRRHEKLPGMTLPEGIAYTEDIAVACSHQDMVVFAVPSVYIRSTARQAAPHMRTGQTAVCVAKGMETDTLMTLTEIIEQELPAGVAVAALSGPTHAEEVALDLPTTIVAASPDEAVAHRVMETFTSPAMRVYKSSDLRGVEICGALKNIIALAAGMADGLGYGDNTKAALITRGLAELTRLGDSLGCAPATFSGLTGMGDLIVTCTSNHSRNHRCGELIGQGLSPEEAIREVGMVVEGINALPAAIRLAEKQGVCLPIIQQVYEVIHHGLSPADGVRQLMSRTAKEETPHG